VFNPFLQQFTTSYGMLRANLTGFDDSNALLTPHGGNSASWLLSHAIGTRQAVILFSGGTPLWDETRLGRWGRVSPPLTDPDEAIPFTQLLSDLERSQPLLLEALQAFTEDRVNFETPMGTLGQLTSHLAIHEAYHAGQLGLLRRALGMAGAIK
jgi:DinB superfamily